MLSNYTAQGVSIEGGFRFLKINVLCPQFDSEKTGKDHDTDHDHGAILVDLCSGRTQSAHGASNKQRNFPQPEK